MADRPVLDLAGHAAARMTLPLQWERAAVEGPFHGAFLPSADEAALVSLLSHLPEEVIPALRIVGAESGWFVLLRAGHVDEPPGPFPLKRLGSGPFVFHPADVAPVPFAGREALERACAGSDLAGFVREGRVDWVRLDDARSLPVEDFFRLPLPVRELEEGPEREAAEPFPRELPGFLPETLPTGSSWERDEQRRLESHPPPKPGFWARLFKRDRPPAKSEWDTLGKPPGFSLRRGLRSFWSWVDKKIGPAAPGAETGWLRKAFDPDQWGGGFLSKILDKQAQMFDRLARLFERGDLETALRHSIPIDNDLMTTLQRGGWLATGWRLPENPVDYSFGNLTRPTAGGGVAPAAPDQIARLSALYRKAAEELSRQGRHRQAAYVFAHLLKDFERAAQELEKGGFHLEAATLVKEKLGRKRQAAGILERGGYVPEAVALLLEDRAFEEAVGCSERAGMKEEAARCLGLWLEDLKKRGHRVQAGDLLWRRMGRPAEARVLFDEELAAPRGMRGQAGARLVAVGEETGGAEFQDWDRCEAFLRAEAEGGGDFARQAGHLVTFHREVRAWAKERELGEPRRGALFRRTRGSMLAAVREAQRRNDAGARGEAVAFLTQVLEEGQDPLAVQDLRKGLEIGVSQGAGSARPRARRRWSAGARALPDGRLFCWVERQWAWTDASGSPRGPVRELGILPRAVAVHPKGDEYGRALVGMVSHDHRIVMMGLDDVALDHRASTPVGEALSIIPSEREGEFLVGTGEGKLVQVRLGKETLAVTPLPDAEEPLALRWLEPWGGEAFVLGGGDGGFDLFIRDADKGLVRVDRYAAPVTGVEHLSIRDDRAFLAGRDATFGYLGSGEGGGGRVSGLPGFGVTSVGICDLEDPDRPLVAAGTEDGRLLFADLVLDGAPRLEMRTAISTSLGPIVAIRALSFGRAIALDAEFRCALVDVRTRSLAYQGAWAG